MTTEPAQAVELTTGSLNNVADAQVGIMIVDAPRIRLGVVEPDGSEHVEWYAEGQTLTASGCEWRVTRVRNPTPGARETVATLTVAAPRSDSSSPPS